MARKIDQIIQWDGRLPARRRDTRRIERLGGVLVHRSVTEDPSPRGLAETFVKGFKWHRVPYTFYCWRGAIHQLAALNVMTPHAGNLNRVYAGLAIHGDARTQEEAPRATLGPMFEPVDVESATLISGLLAWTFDWSAGAFLGHTDRIVSEEWPDKVCPGARFDIAAFQDAVLDYKQTLPQGLSYAERRKYARSCGVRFT